MIGVASNAHARKTGVAAVENVEDGGPTSRASDERTRMSSLPLRRDRAVRAPRRSLAGAALLVLGAAVATPTTAADDRLDDATVAAIMAETGLADATAKAAVSFREQIIAGADEQAFAGGMNADHVAAFKREAARTFTEAAFLAIAADAVAETLGADDAAAVLAHYRSPLGRKTVREGASHDLEDGGVELTRFLMAFENHPEQDARRARAEAMEALIDLSRVVADTTVDTQMALLAGIRFSVPSYAHEELDAVIRQVDGQREAYADAVRPMMVGYLAFTYENFTLAELDAALAFERTPEAGRYMETVERGLRESMRRMSLVFGDRLGKAIAVAEASDEI